jgi:predicted extracellular nuclease
MLASASAPSRRALVVALALSMLGSMLPGITALPARAAVTQVFINEIHYDNAGTDEGEFLEVAFPTGTDLSGWSLVRYNGANGELYNLPEQLDENDLGLLPIAGSSGGFSFVVLDYPLNGLQNGAPDGLALVNNGSVVQFLSYEGSLAATNGPAAGMTSTDIGVAQTASTTLDPVGASLQLTGSGTSYEEFTWTRTTLTTKGSVNTGQSFGVVENQPVTASCGTTLTLIEGDAATRDVTATDPDGTVVGLAIDSISDDPGTITIGETTPATEPGGTASATVSVAATTPAGSYDVTVVATNDDETPQTDDCTFTVNIQPILTIGEVQGATEDDEDGLADRSPFAPPAGNGAGEFVFVRGVITQLGRFPTSSGGVNRGFWIQSASDATDGDPNSSDGIFVFVGGFDTVLRFGGGPTYLPVVGDQVVLQGRVTEFFNLTELGSPRLVRVEASDLDVDEVVATAEAQPDDDAAVANRFWERHEGMRMHLDAGAKVVAARDVFPSTRDGEVWVIRGDHPIAQRANPFERIVYRDPHPLDDIGPAGSFDNGNGMRIMLTSHGLKAGPPIDNNRLIAPARTYDTVENELVGALYFAFEKYSIEIVEDLELTHGVDPATNAPPQAADPDGEFASSDYNVENLYDFRDDPLDGCDFTGNTGCPGVSPPFDYVPASQAAYEKHLADLAEQIAGPMHAPDLLMIQEAEDQDICTVTSGELTCGTTDNADGKPDTLQELALAISAAGGPTYDAAFDRDGADDRGIVAAFLFRTDTVELLPADANDPVLGSSPLIDYRGAPLGYNADVQNPKALNADLPSDVDLSTGSDGGDVFTRAPQVGHFRVWRDGIGSSVFTDLYAISNHFSSGPDGRVGQRTEQAAYNAAIVTALESSGAERILSAGDFNVFPRPDDPFAPGQPFGDDDLGPSDQLGPMYEVGLHNLWDRLVAEVPQSAYSYSFEGQMQTLDMQWATDAQVADLVQVRAGHFNADFAADFDGDVARGASDHDPQLARWFTDVTLARLHALVDYYVGTGDLPARKAFLFHDRLDKAADFLAKGKLAAYRAQLTAFGNQARGHASPFAAAAMEKEGDRLAAGLP